MNVDTPSLAAEFEALPSDLTEADLLTTLSKFLPVAAGFLESFRSDNMNEPSTAAVALPEVVMADIMVHRPQDDHAALRLLAQAPPGQLISSADVMTDDDWKQVDGYQSLQAQGYGGVGAVVLETTSHNNCAEVLYFAMMLRKGVYQWSPRERQLVTAMHKPILGAIQRLAFPLLRRETVLTQLADEQQLGLIVLDGQRRPREANRRAWVWALDHARHQGIQQSDIMTKFAARITNEPRKLGAPRRVQTNGDTEFIEVWEHSLSPVQHRLPAARTLLVLRRELPFSSSWEQQSKKLSDRQKQIALEMAAPGATAFSVALNLGLSPRTIEGHTGTIYKLVNVRSRTELVALIRGY